MENFDHSTTLNVKILRELRGATCCSHELCSTENEQLQWVVSFNLLSLRHVIYFQTANGQYVIYKKLCLLLNLSNKTLLL